MKITDNIFEVGGPTLTHPSDAAIYLVTDGKASALIDAGTGRGHTLLLENIEKAGIDPADLQYLFLTHCHYDHTGGAPQVKGASGCSIVAHDLDAQYLRAGDQYATAASWYGNQLEPFDVDRAIAQQTEEFMLGNLLITSHHIPGHSPGSLAFTIVSGGRLVLFGQDVHGPLNDMLHSNRQDYERSLEFLISLEADILCEGHFGVYRGKENVRDFIESFL